MFCISHWWLILLIHECCFTQSMTGCLRPACTHLLPLFLTLYTFFLRFTHFFFKYTLPHSQWDPKRGKHCSLFHLKIFLTRSYSWMIVCVLVAQSCLTLRDLMDCISAGSSAMEFSSSLPFLSPGDLPNPRIKAGSPALQAGSLEWNIQTVSAQGTTEPHISTTGHCLT